MNYADAISSSQTAIAIAAKLVGGPFAAGYVNFLLGQGSFTAQLADLGQKINDGTATPADYAEVVKSGGDIVFGLGVLTGFAKPAAIAVWTGIGVGLFIYKNRDNIVETWDALGYQPYVWQTDLPEDFTNQINQQANELTNSWLTDNSRCISPTLLTNPDPLIKEIKHFPWVDPLVLDLDGDGLEISPLSAGVQFDTNADTIRTATAWVGADDGLLVLDRNGNGQIDSARELFGDETLLADGKKAAHGFAALADLDVGGAVGATGGAGDGVFDAKDAQFGAVRIWRDLNQDGISQAGELQTMAEAGIASIGLASTATETNYGDAQLVQTGSFVRTDASEGQAGSFILAVDNAVATHPPIAVSAEAAALPQVQGSGWVRGLQEAATLSPQLLGLYGQAGSAGNRAGFTGNISDLLLEWGNESAYVSASEQALAEDGIGLILRDPNSQQELAWVGMAIKASREDRENFRSTLSAADRGAFDTMRQEMVGDLEKLYTYEAFTGCTFLACASRCSRRRAPSFNAIHYENSSYHRLPHKRWREKISKTSFAIGGHRNVAGASQQDALVR